MTLLSPTTLAREALAVASRERGLLVPLAGVFILVPQLAALLFLPVSPAAANATTVAELASAMSGWFRANAVPLVTFLALSLLGQAAITLLLLGRDRPAVGQALRGAVAVLPWLVLATVFANLAVGGGMVLLVLPGLYLLGRTYPLVAVMAVEGWRNPVAGVIRTVRLTRDHGWMLFALQAFIWLLVTMPGAVFARIAEAGGSPVLTFVALLAQAGIATAGAVANTLLQAGLYRRLAARG